ncbi:translation initiation factor IF-2-like [Cuculus canorus]|uniref:translation initiation factor IF-2-like n=1 Tax=Cuculus canorus TaxID=55661 RepID=UPI0023AB39A2|nr:translation initiation factor IF-2-like [Cuculus canorus]
MAPAAAGRCHTTVLAANCPTHPVFTPRAPRGQERRHSVDAFPSLPQAGAGRGAAQCLRRGGILRRRCPLLLLLRGRTGRTYASQRPAAAGCDGTRRGRREYHPAAGLNNPPFGLSSCRCNCKAENPVRRLLLSPLLPAAKRGKSRRRKRDGVSAAGPSQARWARESLRGRLPCFRASSRETPSSNGTTASLLQAAAHRGAARLTTVPQAPYIATASSVAASSSSSSSSPTSSALPAAPRRIAIKFSPAEDSEPERPETPPTSFPSPPPAPTEGTGKPGQPRGRRLAGQESGRSRTENTALARPAYISTRFHALPANQRLAPPTPPRRQGRGEEATAPVVQLPSSVTTWGYDAPRPHGPIATGQGLPPLSLSLETVSGSAAGALLASQ